MATTNFFKQIAELNLRGSLQIMITEGTEGNYIVSVFLKHDECADKAKKLIPPFNFRGTAEELDNGFFNRILAPAKKVSDLLVNMDSFTKQMKTVEKNSAMEKAKSTTVKTASAPESKNKKYEDAMKKVEELENEKKHREAWAKVPSPKDFPEFAELLEKRKAELYAKFAEPDLFSTDTDSVTPQTDEEQEENWDAPADELSEFDLSESENDEIEN